VEGGLLDGSLIEYLDMIFENTYITRLIVSLIIIIIGIITLYLIRKILDKIKSSPGIDERSVENLYRLIKSALTIILAFLILYTLTQQQAIVFFIMGTILIMMAASWEIIANASAYYVILVSRRFGKGDRISIGEITGNIDEITPFYTVVRSEDGVYNIPNLKLLRNAVKLQSESVRTTIKIRIWGIDDPEIARSIIQRIEEEITSLSKPLVTSPRHTQISAVIDEISSDSVSIHINLPVPGPRPNRKKFNRLIQDLAILLKETGYSYSITISD
jgi:hypothetical protein